MPRGRKKSGDGSISREAKLLGPEFCSFVDGAPEEALRDALKPLPLDRANLQAEQEADSDLKSLREQMKTATQRYREGFKRIDLKAVWIRRRLINMGKPVGDISEQEGKTLPPEAFDQLGGKKEDVVEGKATEPKETEKSKRSKKTERAVKEFQQNIAAAPAAQTDPKAAS